MSVWLKTTPSALTLDNGDSLVSVSIPAQPRQLESLLEALSQATFPINPQIYHDALMIYRYADGREESEPVTLVEFPAYEANLDEIRSTLDAYGFESNSVQVTTMLDEIHAESRPESAPRGASWVARYRVKHRAAAVSAPL